MWKKNLFIASLLIFSGYSPEGMAHREGHGNPTSLTIPAPIMPQQNTDNPNFFALFAMLGLFAAMATLKTSKRTRVVVAATTFPIAYIACTPSTVQQIAETVIKSDLVTLEKTFGNFEKSVSTRSDDTYFYVSSNGIPEHNMMVGIKSWQQQVPIDQNYTGDNAWSIPLNPVLASTPVSTKNNFFRGGIGIAANGVPIFNALNNRGEDAFLVGELDQWGGHCGRADDYHYHVAPLHLESEVGANNPIAYALDGFAVYGSKEPDGSDMKTLDENNGHFDSESAYHYHGTPEYPYMVGKMKGKVTKSDSDEIIPQPKSTGVRNFLEPLRGAEITNFESTGANAYSLEYTVNSQKHYVNYNWNDANQYTFNFVSPDGTNTTENYQRK